MATDAAIGHGTQFQRGDGATPTEAFAALGEVTNITAPNMSKDVIDATHMQSPEGWREFVVGLKDPGEITIEFNLVPGGSDVDNLLVDLAATDPRNYKVVFPDSTEWTFSAHCVGVSPAVPLDDKMAGSATYRLTGKPSFFA